MRYGYARGDDHSLAAQIDELSAAGCDDVWFEMTTGSANDKRPELDRLFHTLRPGDEFVVTSLDRFARSARNLADIVADLQQREIVIDVTRQTLTPYFRRACETFAEFERNLKAERQAAGIAAARAAGRYAKCGRPRKQP